MNKQLLFINTLMKKYNIDFNTLQECYEENKDTIEQLKAIYDCNTEHDIFLCSLVPELICPENSDILKKQLYKNLNRESELSFSKQEIDKARVLLITGMYYNTPFYVYSFNWCYFLNNDIIQDINF